MKKTIIILFFVFSYPVFGQLSSQGHIFSDTSLYFIEQIDSLDRVNLSSDELAVAEKMFIQAVEEFNVFQQRYADSVNPKKEKRKQRALQIDINHYFFRLIPALNMENQKVIWISGTCKSWFSTGKRKNPVYSKDWKAKFIDGSMVEDGGSCFIYLAINLTLKTHDWLRMNGMG